jgi:hypothetical protein
MGRNNSMVEDTHVRATLRIGILVAAMMGAASGCSRPAMPSLTGPGKLHDITQVRKGMSPNEVRRVMGSKYAVVFEEGIDGMEGGNYTWEYDEGRVYFNMDGVTRVIPH